MQIFASFFEGNKIPVCETTNMDELVADGDYCLAIPNEMYIVYLRSGAGKINLKDISGNFSVHWFDPRNGGGLQIGTSVNRLNRREICEPKGAPSASDKDWVIILRKGKK